MARALDRLIVVWIGHDPCQTLHGGPFPVGGLSPVTCEAWVTHSRTNDMRIGEQASASQGIGQRV